MAIEIKTICWGGWPHCLSLSNGAVQLIVTTDIGPRIMFLGVPGGTNMMCEVPGTMGASGGDEWRIYGGHRLWHSPEAKPRSYIPDNLPVASATVDGGVRLIQQVEAGTQIRKEIEITLHPDEAQVRVLHRMVNCGPWPVELAVWALTVMAPGGIVAVPQTRRRSDLLPNRMVALWPYARMDDPRVAWGDRYILVRSDPGAVSPFKLGISNEEGWAAYFNCGQLFIKRFPYLPGGRYPDYGCSFETYGCDFMQEVESLSPLVSIAPGAKAEHLEKWELYQGVPLPSFDEGAVEAALKGRAIR